ncbi:hypothetical protein Q7C36_022715 [Tachysurus vachellii]|uniref:Uncharacterized protein n=1 Tax=Tachysurus vachellii TaxID=175792 RepID=A0AA88J0Y1_TACVA|nr:hypothetical protein Q7C36_022715 [Tachysurus vachellii]
MLYRISCKKERVLSDIYTLADKHNTDHFCRHIYTSNYRLLKMAQREFGFSPRRMRSNEKRTTAFTYTRKKQKNSISPATEDRRKIARGKDIPNARVLFEELQQQKSATELFYVEPKEIECMDIHVPSELQTSRE